MIIINKIKKIERKKIYTIFLIALIALPISYTFGRIAYNSAKDYYFMSKKFYFNSDKLTSNGNIYQLENWSGADKYSIAINLNSFINNEVYSNSDIDYALKIDSCSNTVVCELSKESGTISKETHIDYFELSIDPKNNANFSDGSTVLVSVSATSTKPYVKKISATFILKIGKLGLSYEIEDEPNRVYLDLKITNTLDYYVVEEPFDDYTLNSRIDVNTYMSLPESKKNKCHSAIITLEFNPDILTLDMTTSAFIKNIEYYDRTLSDYHKYIYKFSFKIDAISSESIRFYKSDITQNYTYPFVTNNSIVSVRY